MKYAMAGFVVFVLVATIAFGQQSQPSAIGAPAPSTTTTTRMTAETSGPVVDQIKKLEDDWAKAAVTKNIDTLAKVEAPDYQFVMPDGKIRDRQADIAALKDSSYSQFSNDDLNVRVYGDMALVTGVAHIKGTESGKDISGDYRFTDVFVKRDGQWQAVNTTATKVQP